MVHRDEFLYQCIHHGSKAYFPSTTLAVIIPLRCHVHDTQTPVSSSSSVGVRQGYLCLSAMPLHGSARYPRELGSPIVHDARFQGDDSLKIFGRRRVLERCPKFPRLPIIFADSEAQRGTRTPALRLIVSGPIACQRLNFSAAHQTTRPSRSVVTQ